MKHVQRPSFSKKRKEEGLFKESNIELIFLLEQGQRLKKLEARAIREEKEEAERVQVDIGEAKFQAQRRKEAIEKAKTLQYYQTDRVKGFHVSTTKTQIIAYFFEGVMSL